MNFGLDGVDVIKDFVKNLPTMSGIYKMIGVGLDGKSDTILYIGKAKNLKNRVSSYTKVSELSDRIRKMVFYTRRMEYEVTKSEMDALVLEASLIKKYKPAYNILLKDDKSKPYICISTTHGFPRVFKYRGKIATNDKYFGPFVDSDSMERVLEVVKKIFKVRSCSDNEFKIRKRPCLEYQIKRCTAPCVNYVSSDSYRDQVMMLESFFARGTSSLIKEMREKMQILSDSLKFEEAAIVRDDVLSLSGMNGNISFDFSVFLDVDVVAISFLDSTFGIEVCKIRSGLHCGSRVLFFENCIEADVERVLHDFIVQYYSEEVPARHVVVNANIADFGLISEYLSLKCETDVVKITNAKKGKFKELMEFVMPNLLEKLEKEVAKNANIKDCLVGLAKVFGINKSLNRIEIYDNSHISGTNNVGAMVVFMNGKFTKSEYRKFNIKNLYSKNDNDDYGSMKEVLMRRFRDGVDVPDLILLDGGKGQVSSGVSVMAELGLSSIPMVGISKGPDRNAGRESFHFVDGTSKSFDQIDRKVLYFLQNLRDEAHKFAISSHRKRRDKI